MGSYFTMLIWCSLVVIAWQTLGWLRTAGKIRIKGYLPFRRVILVLLLAGVVGAVVFRSTMSGEWGHFAVFVAVIALYVLVPAGPGELAFYYSGRAVPYERFEYFMVIREFSSGFTLRLHERHDGKDYVLLFKKADRAPLIDMLKEHGVHDWDEFNFPSDNV